METSTLPGWHCACGWFNKPTWVVCPGCERQRAEVLAGRAGPERPLAAPPAPQPGAPAQPFGYSAPRKTRRPLRMLLAIVLAVAGYFGGRAVWQEVDDNLLRPERGRSKAQLQQFNDRDQPLTSETAAYATLGRRVVAPDRPFRSAKEFEPGPMTPADMAQLSNGAVTTANLSAAGILRGWVAGWEPPAKDRLVLTMLHEYRDGRDMPLRVEAQLEAVAASTGAPTVTVKMPAGSAAFATTKKSKGGYTVTAVTFAGNRLATVTLVTGKRPGSAEFDWMRALVAKQKAALA